MATFDDVRALATALPEVTEGARWGNTTWFVRKQGFVWDRPLNKTDLAALGDQAPPAGPVLAAYVADLDDKDVLVTEEPDVFFTIPHFTGFRAVLALLDRLDHDRLEELVTDAWLARAPKRLAAAYLADHPPVEPPGR